ncbi:hypothetical protein QR685DRAFT_3856 [Neurospora intermedia]|uniref:PhoD-like phosphatase domain-containing protein n=1 Tax=Neurospora intermedia TaxID=5142 RepID=A0ABR3DNN4_NEUIN
MDSHEAHGYAHGDQNAQDRNPHASSSQWRHQESRAFAKYEAERAQPQAPSRHHHHPSIAREADARGNVNDLADFLNKSRISPKEADTRPPTEPKFKPVVLGATEAREVLNGEKHVADALAPESVPNDKEVAVGPLINYRRMEGNQWVGSVLVVTRGGGREQSYRPSLFFRKAAMVSMSNGNGAANGHSSGSRVSESQGICLYSDWRNTFWRFDLHLEMEPYETKWEYWLSDYLVFASNTKPKVNAFFVPAITESMRIMFHSCNGFSVGTDEEDWSGACLWNDVMRRHQEAPFHVMIGGGDQIYNDGVRVSGPLRTWTSISSPKKRRNFPFPESLRAECDDYYLNNYIRWYGTEPFAGANGQIPQLNIWDDHDIIDGFGSYVDDFMKCDVFRGIGGIAHKYYMLFQHHLPPPASTYTSDTTSVAQDEAGQGLDPNQMIAAYVHPAMTEPNYIVGSAPGPYVAEHSHNMFTKLGARIAFLGIDARTERTRHQVNYPETYEAIFSRLRQELSHAIQTEKPFKHLILLLGIPIAYPRLTWLENIFASPLMGPVKLLNRRVGFGGSFFNSFDGSVDLLDDLDDHYTARTHKRERNGLILKLQQIAAEFSVRVTILGGDVHLAALGRFYSNPKLNIPLEEDYRYIVNVISSAIVNKPPPAAVANLLARRNRIHHLDHDTDETLLKIFDKDPGDSTKTAKHNQVTMPSRNFAVITENSPNNGTHLQNGHDFHTSSPPPQSTPGETFPGQKDGRYALGKGEVNAGTKHKAADPAEHGTGSDGSLDVCIRIEIDQHNPEGRTEGYGLTIPTLSYKGPRPPTIAPPPGSAGSSGSRGTGGTGGSDVPEVPEIPAGVR